MLRSVAELKGFAIQATDGEIGKVDELFFDENTWAVRYLVVDVGNWLVNQRVLVVPAVVEKMDVELRRVSVSLTKEMVEGSPSILTDEPISREKERALHEYYLWQPYWTSYSASPITFGAYPPELVAAIRSHPTGTAAEDVGGDEEDGGSALRSTAEVTGYRVQATDGDVGQVDDFVFDDEEWAIRHLVVDTGGWLASRKVLIAPPWIREIHWAEGRVYVALTKESIEQSPEYDPSILDLASYEKKLLEHYASWFSRLLAKETEKQRYLGKEIVGVPVITVDGGHKIGEMKDVYLEADGQSVAAIYLAKEGYLNRQALLIKRQDVVAIGPDAVLVNNSDVVRQADESGAAENWLRRDELRGRPVQTPGDTNVGKIGDVVLDGDGRVLGFSLGQVDVSGPIADKRAIALHAVSKLGNEDGIMTIDLKLAEMQTLRAE